MALIKLTFLILATNLVKISETYCFGQNGHCNGAGGCGGVSRAYLPVVLTDHFDICSRKQDSGQTPATGQSSTHNVLSNDDLNVLLLLARALEADKTACDTKGIDVDKLLETLVTALVCLSTHTVETSMHRCNTPAQNDANSLGLLGQNGLVDKLLSALVGQFGNANGGNVHHSSQSTIGAVSGLVSGVSVTLEDGSVNNKDHGVARNDGLLDGVLDGVGGVLDGVGGTLNGVGGTLNGVGGLVNTVGLNLDGGSNNKVSKIGDKKKISGGVGRNDGLLNGVGEVLNGIGGTLDGVGEVEGLL